MQKTEQYQLNQWELSDRVRMEDFNADNARLETALAGLQTSLSTLRTSLDGKCGRFQLITSRSISASEGQRYAAGSLAVTNWNKWDCAVWFFDMHETTFQAGETMTFTLNQAAGPLSRYEVTLDAGSLVMMLFPMGDKTSTVKGFILGGAARPLVMDVAFETVTGYNIYLPASTATRFHNAVITAYGLK